MRLRSGWALGLLFVLPIYADPVDSGPVSLTSTRTAYTIAEPIEFSVPGGRQLYLQSQDKTLLTVTVPARGTPVRPVTIAPGALKPGPYTAWLDHDTPDHGLHFTVARDDNPNAFWVASWTDRNPDPPTVTAKSGWMSFSSDLIAASVRQPKPDDIMDAYVAARMKPFSRMVMGGGHQMDLQVVNDWGDPWVQRAVLWKMGLAALSNRFYPSAGIHAFDEPGLTWWPDANGKPDNPFVIPSELEDFKHFTGLDMPTGTARETLPLYSGMLDTWLAFGDNRMKFLEQAWTGSVWAVDTVHPQFTTINQVASGYGRGDVTDGVDTRMDRAYRVISSHGGYSDWAGSFGPVMSAEADHGWAWDKPHYFLPMWTQADYPRMRQEVWLPWSTKLEGIMYDPNHDWSLGGSYLDTMAMVELAEVNRRMKLVGDVMTRLPKALSPVAVLISSRQYLYDVAMANHPTALDQGAYQSAHLDRVKLTFHRILATGRVPNWIDESEVSAKGADFLKQWKVVYCPGLATITPDLRQAIEGYVAAGGKFIQNQDDPLKIPGSVVTDYPFKTRNDDNDGTVDPRDLGDYGWRQWELSTAPTFARDLDGWLGPEPYRSTAPPNAMLLTVHPAGPATYLLMANDQQAPGNPRAAQFDPVSLDTSIHLPTGGVTYDLLNGGIVPEGLSPLHLGPGDGACWLHLPQPPGPPHLAVSSAEHGTALRIALTWGTAGYLPFRLSIDDPSGHRVDDLYRCTLPGHGFNMLYRLGANAAPGHWSVKVSEWLTGTDTGATADVPALLPLPGLATVNTSPVSVYLQDEVRIHALLTGHAALPPYDKMNWDLPRVMDLDPKRFAVFGPDAAAHRIAAALQAHGMTVTVNPPYEVKPFTREPGHGGTGPIQDHWQANFEDIYAHAVVLPGSPLGDLSWQRGHINRPITPAFPGPGRAYIQWGIGGYQAGYEDVWAFGDLETSVQWILGAIDGTTAATPEPLAVTISRPPVKTPVPLPKRFRMTRSIHLQDTPVGVGRSPDGKVLYTLLAGGEVQAWGPDGHALWKVHPLLQGGTLAVSPQGDRVAVAGFPGLFLLDAVSGQTVASSVAPPLAPGQSYECSRMIAVAWSSDGTLVAGGWLDQSNAVKGTPRPTLGLALMDHDGHPLPSPAVTGSVYGLDFLPGTDTLLVGGPKLQAVDARTGAVLWSAPVANAQAFDTQGSWVAAGGWGNQAGILNAADGSVVRMATFEGHVGGVALTPNQDLVVAVWGKTRPLFVLRGPKPEPFFQDDYGFHDVHWSPALHGLVAAEEGGKLWLLEENGKPLALASSDLGATAGQTHLIEGGVLVGRMDRSVQEMTLQSAAATQVRSRS